MSPDLMDQVRLLDPATGVDPVAAGLWEGEEVLAELDRRLTAPDTTKRPPLRRSLLVAAAAAVIVLLVVGGAAWLLRVRTPVEPAEDPSVTSTTVESAPQEDGVETVTYSTPGPTPVVVGEQITTPSSLGDFTWTGYESNVGDAPGPGPFVVLGSAFLATDDGNRLWASDDGLTWRSAQPPGGTQFLSMVATRNGALLTGLADGRPVAWHSTDGVAWSAVDLTGIVPDVDGFAWLVEVQNTSTDATELRRWQLTPFVDWGGILGITRRFFDTVWDTDAQTVSIEIVADDAAKETRVLSYAVIEEPGSIAIEFTEIADPSFTARISAASGVASADELLSWLVEGRHRFIGYTLGAETVEPPWEEVGEFGLTLVALDQSFYALVPTGEGQLSPADAWRSDDGRSWTQIEPPPFASGAAKFGELLVKDGVVLAGVYDTSNDQQSLWRTDGGESWEQIEAPVAPFDATFNLHAGDFGWVMHHMWPGPFTPWVSTDGIEWEQLDVSPLVTNQEPDDIHHGGLVTPIGHIRFAIAVGGDDPERVFIWIGQLDTS